MSFEDEYAKRPKKKDPLRPFYPVMGLVLMVAFAAIAWAVHEPVRDLAVEQMASLPQQGEDGFEQVGYISGGIVFIVLVLVSALLFSIFAPKPNKMISESQLKREKDMLEAERLARKKRQSAVRKQMASERKKK